MAQFLDWQLDRCPLEAFVRGCVISFFALGGLAAGRTSFFGIERRDMAPHVRISGVHSLFYPFASKGGSDTPCFSFPFCLH
jgi:hypothetical protein